MTQQLIDIGIQGNDGTGDSIRESFRKVNENFNELYAAFGLGGQLGLSDLADGPESYGNNQVIMSSTNGATLTARSLISSSNALTIDTSDNTKIIFNANTATLAGDETPTLSVPLNVGEQIIANIADPSQWGNKLDEFNTLFNISPPATLDSIATSVKYVTDNFVKTTNTTVDGDPYRQVTDILRVRDEPAVPQTEDPDYDSTLPGNYLPKEAVQRQYTVRRSGDRMTGPLVLNEHPYPVEQNGPIDDRNLQAATKYYVDNQVFSSGINLFVSTTTGDDLQIRTPPGKEGRFWQYAYKTIGAAALAAENIQASSLVEPGPYRQKITYNSSGADQYFSTIQTINTTGGNTATPGYPDAYYLLIRNIDFMKNETIAYINNKYVNPFVFDTPTLTAQLVDVISSVGQDLVVNSTFNSTNVGTKLLDTVNTNTLSQTIDAIRYTRNQIKDWAFTASEQAALTNYVEDIIDALCFDLVFFSNFQSTQLALGYYSVDMKLDVEEFATSDNSVLKRLKTSILAIPSVASNPTAGTSISNNIDLMINIIRGEEVQTPEFTELSTYTTNGEISAKDLLLNNISFIQSEVIAYLQSNFPGLAYDRNKCRRDVKYIIWSLVYDFLYGGNSASVYAGLQYWKGTQLVVTTINGTNNYITVSSTSSLFEGDPVVFTGTTFGGINAGQTYYVYSIINGTQFTISDTPNGDLKDLTSGSGTMALRNRNIGDDELQATIAAYEYLGSVAVNVVQNIALPTTYQTSVIQYLNITLEDGIEAVSSINQNIASINGIIEFYTIPATVTPVITPTIVTVTATQVATNFVTVNDNSVLQEGDPIVFTGNTSSPLVTLGGLLLNYTYYVLSIESANRITLAATQGSGSPVTLQTSAGTLTGTVGFLLGVRSAILANKTALSNEPVTYILTIGSTQYPTINNQVYLDFLLDQFDLITNLLSFGIEYRSNPTFDSALAGLSSGDQDAIALIEANYNFLIDAGVNYILGLNPTYTFYGSLTRYKLLLRYSIEAAIYDSIYSGNVASIDRGLAWFNINESTIDSETSDALAQIATWAISCAKNILISSPPPGTIEIQQTTLAGNTLSLPTETQISDSFVVIIATGQNGTYPTNIATTDPVGTTSQQQVRTTLLNNSISVASDTINYLNTVYNGGFNYNESLCARDLGLIVSACALDIYTNGNALSVSAGKSYYRNASALKAITDQLTETVDALQFAKNLGIQVLNQTEGERYQDIELQVTDNALNASSSAIADFVNCMDLIISIINNGIGAAPQSTYGDAVWTITVNNGGQGYADQGYPGTFNPIEGNFSGGNNHILSGKILVGVDSEASGLITSYTPGIISVQTGGDANVDTLTLKLTRPFLFKVGEELEFSETVQAQNILIQVESGIYYEDYPIRVPANVSIRGDEFRRTIVRPLNRISQSPWRTVFFYRDAIIDGLQIGLIDSSVDYAPRTSITIGSASGTTQILLEDGVAPASFIGKVIQDNYVESITATEINPDGSITVDSLVGINTPKTIVFSGSASDPLVTTGGIVLNKTYYIKRVYNTVLTENIIISETINGEAVQLNQAIGGSLTARVPNPGKAVVTSVSNDIINCTVIYPFNEAQIETPYYSLDVTNITNPSGTEAIISFADLDDPPFQEGQVITVTGANPVGYNGTHIVQSCTINSVSFLSEVSSAYVTGGIVSNWHLYDTVNYGHHYLTNPLDITSPAKNNNEIDVFLCNDQNRLSNMTFQGHGGFSMVLDPTGQIKTKSPYGQVNTSFSRSINAQTFAGGQFVDGFAGRLNGFIKNISYNAITGFDTAAILNGSGYTPTSGKQIYQNVPLNGGTGTGAVAEVTVIDGQVVIITVPIQGSGTGYTVNDVITISNTYIGGTGSGFQVPVKFVSGEGLYITVQGTRSARGTYVSGATSSTTLVVNNVSGAELSEGMPITGIGFDGSQTITGISGPVGGQYTLTISNFATAQPQGTIVFGRSSGLDFRSPQVPCAYYVEGNRFQINEVLEWNPSTATVILQLDTSTPYAVKNFYNNAKSTRDTSYTTRAALYDVVTGSNYQSVASGRSFNNPSNELVQTALKTQCLAGLRKALETAQTYTTDEITKDAIAEKFNIVIEMLDKGIGAEPVVTYPTLGSTDLDAVKAKNILQEHRAFLQQEGTAWLNSQPIIGGNVTLTKNIPSFSSFTFQTYIGYMIDAICYDLMYGGNSQTYDFVQGFYRPAVLSVTAIDVAGNITVSPMEYLAVDSLIQFDGTSFGGISNSTNYYITSVGQTSIKISTVPKGADFTPPLGADLTGTMTALSQTSLIPGQEIYYQAMFDHLNDVMQDLIVNNPIAKSNGNNLNQNISLDPATSAEITIIDNLMTNIDVGIEEGDFNYSRSNTIATSGNTNFNNAFTAIIADLTTIGQAATDFINIGANLKINIEMGGNKSMLANDFAMINDLGYAIFCINSGLSEQVSTFSYYCHTHYWAANGGQIRSVAGSNAHGTYGLRASGSDVTELPDLVALNDNLTQTAQIYKQGIFSNTGRSVTESPAASLSFYIINYEYVPTNISEVEIDHTLEGGLITRYLISNISRTVVTINNQNVLQLNISTSGTASTSTSGLTRSLYDGQMIIIRTLQNIKFRGITNVKPVRPSTAVQFIDNLATVYRVLSYGLAESTGESLLTQPGKSILNSATSFGYYQTTTDTGKLSQLDPQIENVFYITGITGDGAKVTVTFPKQDNIPFEILTKSVSATTTYTINVNNITGIAVGYKISGTNIDTNTFVTQISGSIITLSKATLGPVTSVTVTPVIQIVNVDPVSYNNGGLNPASYEVAATPAPSENSVSFSSTVTDGYNFGGMIGPISAITQGAAPGDNKIAVFPIANQNVISFLNRGTYIFSYNGRTHRILGYTANSTTTTGKYTTSQPNGGGAVQNLTNVSAAGDGVQVVLTFTNPLEQKLFAVGQEITVSGLGAFDGTFVVTNCQLNSITYLDTTTGTDTGGTISGYYVINVEDVPSEIKNGDLLRGNGYLASQNVNVVSTNLIRVNGVYSGKVVVTGAYNSSPVAGTNITFGLITNAYISIDPNSITNIAGYGASIYALTYIEKKSSQSVTTTGSGSTGFNTVIVSSTVGLQPGYTVTALGIPANTTIQAINGNTLTLSDNLDQNLVNATLVFTAGTGSATTFVRYSIAWDPFNTPIVDNWYYIQNQSNDSYNGWHQVNGLTSFTSITVPDTSKLSIGQLITTPSLNVTNATGNGTTVTLTFAEQDFPPFKVGLPIKVESINFTLTSGVSINGTFTVSGCTDTTVSYLANSQGTYVSGGNVSYTTSNYFYIPEICIIQDVTSTTTFKVSPAIWIPDNFTIVSSAPSVVETVTITFAGTGYTKAPELTWVGTATTDPIATCTVEDGSVVTVKLVSPGYGIVGSGFFQPSFGNATFSVILSSAKTVTKTTFTGQNTTEISVVYDDDPGLFSVGASIPITGFTSITSGQTYTIGTTTFTGYKVRLSFASTPAPTVDAYYQVIGNTNDLYNGFYPVIASDALWVDLFYQFNPGTFAYKTAKKSTGITVTPSGLIFEVKFTFSSAVTNAPTIGIPYVISGAANTSLLGTFIATASTVNDITFEFESDPISFGTATVHTATLNSGPTLVTSGALAGFYILTLDIATFTGTPITGNYFELSGNTNTNINGIWKCVGGTTTSIQLNLGTANPGAWSTATPTSMTEVCWIEGGSETFIAKEVTNATSNSLGISRPFSTSNSITLRVGYAAGAPAQITQQISTCRATGHDFLQIGTGGYVTTNYPFQIYGNPALGPFQENEIKEEGVGRVFYVTSDQNGIFRVGKYFSVDQGTGTVTFSSNIALSNLDGLGFKRGVVVSEFSTDSTFTDNATDQVPVQSAVRAYIDSRLGITHGGSVTPSTSLIGPGFLPLDGSLSMKSALNMNSQALTGLPLNPSNSTDATSKSYVDKLTGFVNAVEKLTNTVIKSPSNGSTLSYDSNAYKQVKVTGATSTGAVNTLTFTEGISIPFTPGQVIFVTDVNPIEYNTGPSGAVVITATSKSVSYAVVGAPPTSQYIDDGIITFVGSWRNVALPTGDVNHTYTNGVQCYATITTASNDRITLTFPLGETTADLSVNWPIRFTGTDFGNLVSGFTYYIKSLHAPNQITVSQTQGGATFQLADASSPDLPDGLYGTAGAFTTTTIQAGKIVNSMVNATAAIAQSKLDMQAADTSSSAPGTFTQSVLGLARFNNSVFTATFGWVDLKTATSVNAPAPVLPTDGVNLSKLTHIAKDRFLGRGTSGSDTYGPVTTFSSGEIVELGDGIKNADFSAAEDIPLGTMTVNFDQSSGTSANTYGIISISSTGAANNMLRVDSAGYVDASVGFKIGTIKIAERSGTGNKVLDFYTQDNFKFLESSGATVNDTTTKINGSFGVGKGMYVGTVPTPAPTTWTGLTVYTGGMTITGDSTLTGDLTLSGTSSDISVGGNATVNGKITTTSITSGSSTTFGNLEGAWKLTGAGTYIDFTGGGATNLPLYTRQISANYPGSPVGSLITGTITGNWTVASGSRLGATYADLAEYYEGDSDYDPGTVLIFGGEKEVTASTDMNDTRLAGVVTTNPAFVMNEEQTGIKICVALAGRVPCKVIGRVKKGDMLTTSNTPGYAVKATTPTLGAIIGKAIEDKDYGEAGVIQVAVGRM